MMVPDRPRYRYRPIGSANSLARVLEVSVPELLRLAATADRLYRGPIRRPKKVGGYRETFDALPALKALHRKIHNRILTSISFPDYLMGGLRDPERSRGYVRNARRHAGARLLIGEDAENFFPSVTSARIAAAFRHVCRFPPPVANLLAKLCTRHGVLPQGAITSPYLANLALYREEPELHKSLSEQGIEYTRFIDDMNASTKQQLSAQSRTEVVRMLRGALERAGLRPKRKKQVIAGSGSQMVVNNLNVDKANVSRNRRYRHNLRAAVHQLEIAARCGEFDSRIEKAFHSAATRVAGLRELNPKEAERLQYRLRRFKQARRHAIRSKVFEREGS